MGPWGCFRHVESAPVAPNREFLTQRPEHWKTQQALALKLITREFVRLMFSYLGTMKECRSAIMSGWKLYLSGTRSNPPGPCIQPQKPFHLQTIFFRTNSERFMPVSPLAFERVLEIYHETTFRKTFSKTVTWMLTSALSGPFTVIGARSFTWTDMKPTEHLTLRTDWKKGSIKTCTSDIWFS